MLILQDTVRRECEERLELTQALSDARMQLLSSPSSGTHRNSPSTKSNPRMLNRTGAANRAPVSRTLSNSEVSSSVVDLGFERKIKRTGSDTPKATRESVDSFRERIAVALGRQSRANHTRWHFGSCRKMTPGRCFWASIQGFVAFRRKRANGDCFRMNFAVVWYTWFQCLYGIGKVRLGLGIGIPMRPED